MLVEGPAGIGKTTLLRAACQRARGRRAQVLTARGLALERDFPYGIVRQLIEPVRAAAPRRSGPDCWTARPGLRPGCSTGPGPDGRGRHAIRGHARLVLAGREPGGGPPAGDRVDDGHWADTASLRWLTHLAQRIEDVPVALLMAVRTGPASPRSSTDLRAARVPAAAAAAADR